MNLCIGIKATCRYYVVKDFLFYFSDFQPFDVDAFLENLHQRRQQQQQEYRG